jgi:NAD(P)-dependent dehydrogenase (short-subunit alcohol dehydrogenase family)
MTHALVIGGSGMLRGAALDLAQEFQSVSVVGRSPRKLDRLREANTRINPIQADYTDFTAFMRAIERAIAERGAISLVVSWIHDTAPDAPLELASHLHTQGNLVDYYHVLGSESASPHGEAVQLRDKFAALGNIRYHQVILGFIIEGRRSRWLSNEEISSGVSRAIKEGLPVASVGATEPWDKRP